MLAELVARPYCLFRRCNKICLNYQLDGSQSRYVVPNNIAKCVEIVFCFPEC